MVVVIKFALKCYGCAFSGGFDIKLVDICVCLCISICIYLFYVYFDIFFITLEIFRCKSGEGGSQELRCSLFSFLFFFFTF